MPIAIPETTVAATAEPVSPAEVRKQLELPASDTVHTDHLNRLITLAREQVEHDTGIVAMSTTKTFKLDAFPSTDYIILPQRPVQSITSITYIDTGGTSQTWSSGSYTLDTGRVRPVVWLNYGETYPATRDVQNAVTITAVYGYSSAANVPELMNHAILVAIAREFEDRIGVGAVKARFGGSYENIISRLMRSSYP